MVPEQYAGKTFRQFARELRWVKDGTNTPDLTSARPYDKSADRFLDSDEHPTLVAFAADDNVDVEFLLKMGALVPHEAPEPSPAAAGEGDEAAPSPESSPRGRGGH